MIKPNKSFRIDPKLLEKADKIGLPIVDIFEAALASTLQTNECPYCRQDFLTANKLKAICEKIEKWAEAGNIHHSGELMEEIDKIYEDNSFETE